MAHAPLQTPQEIYDHIIDHVWNDQGGNEHHAVNTLRACALASRTFTPRAQAYLFQTITLTQEHDFASLLATYSGSPHLSRYTNHLCVKLPGSASVWSSPAAGHVLQSLRHVSVLTLSFPDRLVYGRRAPDTLAPQVLALAGLNSVKTLHLDACTFQTRAAHDTLFQSFPSLVRLEIGKCVKCWECVHYRSHPVQVEPSRRTDARDATVVVAPALAHLKHLTFDCGSEAGRCILRVAQPERLDSLEILGAGFNAVTPDVLSDVIEAVGHVEEVTVDLCCPPVPLTLGPPTGATRYRCAFPSTSDDALDVRIEAVLDGVYAANVRHLKLRIDQRACNGASWVDIGVTLATQCLSMEVVTIVMQRDVRPETESEVLDKMEEGMLSYGRTVRLEVQRLIME